MLMRFVGCGLLVLFAGIAGFFRVFGDRPRSAETLHAGDPAFRAILIDSPFGYTPFLRGFLYRKITVQFSTAFQGESL